jgi:hypothetical protein
LLKCKETEAERRWRAQSLADVPTMRRKAEGGLILKAAFQCYFQTCLIRVQEQSLRDVDALLDQIAMRSHAERLNVGMIV